jgi:hypothetical protein
MRLNLSVACRVFGSVAIAATFFFGAPDATAQQTRRPSARLVPNVEVGTPAYQKASSDWVDLMTEGFEDTFPTGAWYVFDYDGAFNGEYIWGADDFKPHAGVYSAWPAASGANGADPEASDYPDDCWTWMIYGPFDLSKRSAAELQFFYWNISELGHDTFSWGASGDGTSFDLAASVSGDSLGWQFVNYDLAAYVGDSSVWVAFIFQSDSSNTFQGPFVDDVLLRTTDPSLVFLDNFESGDTSAWSSVVGETDLPPPTACNPVANTGCQPGDKCTLVVETVDPFSAYLGCADDGVVPLGGSCTREPTTGVDDCVAGSLCMAGFCKEICTVAPNSCGSGSTCSNTGDFFNDPSLGLCEQNCDLFAQDCPGGETCYLLLQSEGYPTVCAPTVPEPDTAQNGCEPVEKLVPQEQGECCSYINTCNVGLGCTQPTEPGDGLACGEFCDPTETVGIDDCFTKLGAGFHCLAINRFYTDVADLENIYGFCLDEDLWGPASCYNLVQDADEDGVDCCSDGGEPSCLCASSCG